MTMQIEFPVIIAKEILKLTPWLETPNDPVRYHEADAELKAFLLALTDFHDLLWGPHPSEYWRELAKPYPRSVVIRFIVMHHYNPKPKEELAKQLLNVIHYFPEDLNEQA